MLGFNNKFKKYDLNHKVDTFIKGYSKSLREFDVGTDIGKFQLPRNLRDFIESKAVYAELRWPFFHYNHLEEQKMQGNEKVREIFFWENFDRSKSPEFHTLDMTNEDINQQVLHRIIERGGNRTGPRRGLLFAQDFGLDINIPVSYAIDWSDPSLYSFIEPLISELDPKRIYPVEYFSRNSNKLRNVEEMIFVKVLQRLSIKELKRQHEASKYTP